MKEFMLFIWLIGTMFCVGTAIPSTPNKIFIHKLGYVIVICLLSLGFWPIFLGWMITNKED